MEPFQKNSVGAPYDLKFNQIYEHLENVEQNSEVNTESVVESETSVENKDKVEVKTEIKEEVKDEQKNLTPEEVRKLASELIKEAKKEELKKQEEEKKEAEKPKDEAPAPAPAPDRAPETSIWFYLGIVIVIGVALALVYHFFGKTSASPKAPTLRPVISNMKYSLSSPSSTSYETSEYFPNSLRNLKNLSKH